MALRICNEILHGELDNRHPGRTTGILHFANNKEPLTLDLIGSLWRDLSSHRLIFKNPPPGPTRESRSNIVRRLTERDDLFTASHKINQRVESKGVRN